MVGASVEYTLSVQVQRCRQLPLLPAPCFLHCDAKLLNHGDAQQWEKKVRRSGAEQSYGHTFRWALSASDWKHVREAKTPVRIDMHASRPATRTSPAKEVPLGYSIIDVSRAQQSPIVTTYTLKSLPGKGSRGSPMSSTPEVFVGVSIVTGAPSPHSSPAESSASTLGTESPASAAEKEVEVNQPQETAAAAPVHHDDSVVVDLLEKMEQHVSDSPVAQRSPVPHSTPGNSSTDQSHADSFAENADDDDKHKWSLSVELSSLEHSALPPAAPLYVMYRYPVFGSVAPVRTSPAVHVFPHQQAPLPNGHCTFEFRANMATVIRALSVEPLLLELYSDAAKVAVGMIRLSDVLSARMMTTDEGARTKAIAVQVPLCAVGDDGSLKKMCVCHTRVRLDDLGPVYTPEKERELQRVYLKRKLTPEPTFRQKKAESIQPTITAAGQTVPSPSRDGGKVVDSHDFHEEDVSEDDESSSTSSGSEEELRETAEYQAAMDIELWKRNEEQKFFDSLAAREEHFLKELEQKAAAANAKQEEEYSAKMHSVLEMETKLQSLAADLQVREERIVDMECVYKRRMEEMQRVHDREMEDMQQRVNAMREELSHRVDIEKKKYDDISKYNAQLKTQNVKLNKQIDDLSSEYRDYRLAQANSDVAELRAQVAALKADKSVMECKCEKLTTDLERAKEQWKKALKACMRKDREHTRELMERKDAMPMYSPISPVSVCHPPPKATSPPKSEMDDLSDKLNHIAEEAEQLKQAKQEAARLRRERDALLRTGVYRPTDTVISNLNKRIDSLIG